jgi:hydroxymethylbilane synthase
MRLIIASRKSDLARIQAQNVARLLKESNNELEIIHEYTSSFGDQNPDIPLWQMPEKGAFTEDFREKLESGKVDMVVHSWKDLPTELSPTSMIFTVKRADPRDLILFKRTVCQKQQLKIMTSSPRRQFHLPRFIQEFFPAKIATVESIPVRGNIPTRLSKFMKEDVDGIIVAKAAIDRILETTTEEYAQIRKNIKETINQCLWMIPPLSHFPTAPAQGALAIEVNRDNSAVTSLLDKIHHQQTYDHVKKERDILRSYGGGCHQKIGVTSYPTTEGNYFSMSGQSPEGDLLSELAFKREEKNITWPRPDSKNVLFPVRPSSELFFTRKSLELEKIPPGDLFISRYHDGWQSGVFKKIIGRERFF